MFRALCILLLFASPLAAQQSLPYLDSYGCENADDLTLRSQDSQFAEILWVPPNGQWNYLNFDLGETLTKGDTMLLVIHAMIDSGVALKVCTTWMPGNWFTDDVLEPGNERFTTRAHDGSYVYYWTRIISFYPSHILSLLRMNDNGRGKVLVDNVVAIRPPVPSVIFGTNGKVVYRGRERDFLSRARAGIYSSTNGTHYIVGRP